MINVRLNICIIYYILKICNRYKLRDKCIKNIISLCNGNNDINYLNYLANILREYTNRNLAERTRDGTIFEYIVLSINDTIHFLLEPIISDKDLLPVIGQELFNICCSHFVGHDFITKLPVESKKYKNERN